MLSSAVRPVLVGVALAILALASVTAPLKGDVPWTPDGLFYQEILLELRGVPPDEAMKTVFEGPMSAELRQIDPDHVGDPEWVANCKKTYSRRLAVPFVAAALYPFVGDRAILLVSLAGYGALVFLLYLFLRAYFTEQVALGAVAATAFYPPLRTFSTLPLTDSWGVALEVGALIFALRVLRGSRGSLVGWISSLVVLGFTRENGVAVVLGTLWVAATTRSRQAWMVAATGAGAAAIAPLLLSVPFRELLAFVLNGYHPVPAPTWDSIARRYPGGVLELVRGNIGFLRRGQWYTLTYLLVGIGALYVPSWHPRKELPITFLRAVVGGSLVYLALLPNYSAFRLELVFLPMAAFGVATALALLENAARRSLEPPPARGS